MTPKSYNWTNTFSIDFLWVIKKTTFLEVSQKQFSPLIFPKIPSTWWKNLWGRWLMNKHHKTKTEIQAEYEIIQKAQQDIRHFTPIYEKYYEPIFIFVNRRLDDEDTTAEITSEIFCKVLANLRKFKFQGVPFSAWLFRIAVNEVNQFFRQQKNRQRAVSLQDSHIELLFEEMEFGNEEPDKHVLIKKLLETLKPQEVQFLELRFFENHSFKEMGYLLDMSEVNAKIKTYRIIKKLRKKAYKILAKQS